MKVPERASEQIRGCLHSKIPSTTKDGFPIYRCTKKGGGECALLGGVVCQKYEKFPECRNT